MSHLILSIVHSAGARSSSACCSGVGGTVPHRDLRRDRGMANGQEIVGKLWCMVMGGRSLRSRGSVSPSYLVAVFDVLRTAIALEPEPVLGFALRHSRGY